MLPFLNEAALIETSTDTRGRWILTRGTVALGLQLWWSSVYPAVKQRVWLGKSRGFAALEWKKWERRMKRLLDVWGASPTVTQPQFKSKTRCEAVQIGALFVFFLEFQKTLGNSWSRDHLRCSLACDWLGGIRFLPPYGSVGELRHVWKITSGMWSDIQQLWFQARTELEYYETKFSGLMWVSRAWSSWDLFCTQLVQIQPCCMANIPETRGHFLKRHPCII